MQIRVSKNIVKFGFFYLFTILILVFLTLTSMAYVPSSPTGITQGFTNHEYEFKILTYDVGSYWKFSWGDGNTSSWIEADGTSDYVKSTYSWDKAGLYNVQLKYKSKYGEESIWSDPLIVNIEIPEDIDNDGWNNTIENSYNTDPENSSSYPQDTDSDGTADNTSPDGKYDGDLDDDNDGFDDTFEVNIGSNSKISDDILSINIEQENYYFIDEDLDDVYDLLSDKSNNKYDFEYIDESKISIDINNDGEYDYRYNVETNSISGVLNKEKKDSSTQGFPWMTAIITVVLVVICVIVILFKTGIIYFYEEEYDEEEYK